MTKYLAILVTLVMVACSNNEKKIIKLVSVSVGGSHTCGLKPSGELYCWGDNHHGQIGDGTIDDKNSPTRVGIESDWGSVSARREDHTCGVKVSGSLYCWGDNQWSELGDGTENDRATPTRIGTESDWASVEAGDFSTCGVKKSGELYCWGNNWF
ncbi:MAG TPA: hypothetical protein P5077_07110, partial [bacterium]|nr:hypothetical protein [bacterium]